MWEGYVGTPRGQPWDVGEHIPGLILFNGCYAKDHGALFFYLCVTSIVKKYSYLFLIKFYVNLH